MFFWKTERFNVVFAPPGMLMSAKALLDKNPNPSEDEIKDALEGNLCRCTGYIPIINSVKGQLQKIKKYNYL